MSSKKIIDLRGGKKDSQSPILFPIGTKRRPTLRDRRRRVRILLGFCLLLICGGGVWGIHVLSYLPEFSINTISVNGAKELSNDAVKNFIDQKLGTSTNAFFSPRNMFVYPKMAIEKGLSSAFPRVASVNISRASLLAQAIRVEISERAPYARWCTETHDCYLLDKDGFLFAPDDVMNSPESTYLFSGGIASSSPIGETFLPGNFKNVVGLLDALKSAEFHPQGARVVDDQDYEVPLSEGFFLKVSVGEDPDMVSKNLALVLASETLRGKESALQYIDLRFGNRVYYKLAGAAEASAQ